MGTKGGFMKKLLLIAVLGFLTTACSKKEDAPKPYTPHVAGTWVGNGTDDAIGFYNLAVDLTQSGDSASGNFTMAGAVTIKGTVSVVIGPQGGNNLQQMIFTPTSSTVNDPALAGRVCSAPMTVRPGSTYMLSGSTVFGYTVSDCQGGTWGGGANMKKTIASN